MYAFLGLAHHVSATDWAYRALVEWPNTLHYICSVAVRENWSGAQIMTTFQKQTTGGDMVRLQINDVKEMTV